MWLAGSLEVEWIGCVVRQDRWGMPGCVLHRTVQRLGTTNVIVHTIKGLDASCPHLTGCVQYQPSGGRVGKGCDRVLW